MLKYGQKLYLNLSRLQKATKTIIHKQTGQSDIARWSKQVNLNDSWDERTKLLASLIPCDSSILEFGAGRLRLPLYLPPNCVYTPSDLVDRGYGTIVCDLNALQLPAFSHYDVVVIGGVLEYVHDVHRLIAHLAACCKMIVASYAATDFENQNKIIVRREQGWVNDFSAKELQEIFSEHGFKRTYMTTWRSQYLFKWVQTLV